MNEVKSLMGKVKVISQPTPKHYKLIYATFTLRDLSLVDCGMFVLTTDNFHSAFLKGMESRTRLNVSSKRLNHPNSIRVKVVVIKKDFTKEETLTNDPKGKILHLVKSDNVKMRLKGEKIQHNRRKKNLLRGRCCS